MNILHILLYAGGALVTAGLAMYAALKGIILLFKFLR